MTNLDNRWSRNDSPSVGEISRQANSIKVCTSEGQTGIYKVSFSGSAAVDGSIKLRISGITGWELVSGYTGNQRYTLNVSAGDTAEYIAAKFVENFTFGTAVVANEGSALTIKMSMPSYCEAPAVEEIVSGMSYNVETIKQSSSPSWN